MDTYVLVHGAWHDGNLLKDVASAIETDGHTVFLPTLKGNQDGDSKKVGLDDAIDSLISYIKSNNIENCILVGHSYAGMVITGAFDRLGKNFIKRD